jgi:hypothetical protein
MKIHSKGLTKFQMMDQSKKARSLIKTLSKLHRL